MSTPKAALSWPAWTDRVRATLPPPDTDEALLVALARSSARYLRALEALQGPALAQSLDPRDAEDDDEATPGEGAYGQDFAADDAYDRAHPGHDA